MQLTNLVQNTTTHKRFAFKGNGEDSEADGDTDRKSMLLRDSGEWIPEMSRSGRDTYSKAEDEDILKTYCCRKRAIDSNILINESNLDI